MGWIPNPFKKVSDEVKFNRGDFFVTYAEMKSAATLLIARLGDASKAGRLTPDAALTVARIADSLKIVDGKIQVALRNPDVEIDWEAVLQAVKLIIQLASAIA